MISPWLPLKDEVYDVCAGVTRWQGTYGLQTLAWKL